MAIVAIFSGSFCQADEVANSIADNISYSLITDHNLLETFAADQGIAIEKLKKVLYGPASFFNRLTREKELLTAALKAVVVASIQSDNVVIHGPSTLLLPKDVRHILRICIIADYNYRVKNAAGEKNLSEKDAEALVRKDDNRLFQWSQYLTDLSPWEEELYDIVIPMHSSSVEDAVKIIAENVGKDVVAATEKSKQAARDALLAANVEKALIKDHQDIEIKAENGKVLILINKQVSRLEHKKEELRKQAGQLPDVKEVEVRIGPKYHIPSVYPPEDFSIPQKVLLVDDEKDFVHTLSERLKTRNFKSTVVYDGEEALSFVEGDEPEVMILDLKMPGIDGIEVLRKVKQDHPQTEVIILTGHGSDREQSLAKELGAFAYLKKPVDIDQLSETMKQAYKKIRDSKG